MSQWQVPIIDIGPFRAGNRPATRQIGAAIDAACQDAGFLVIRNHGVAQQLIDEAFAVSMEFFDLPPERKNSCRPPTRGAPRGYQSFASRNLARTFGLDAPPDLREQFFLGPMRPALAEFASLPEAQVFYADNIWPQEVARFRPVLETYYHAMELLSGQLMQLFAIALQLPSHYFDDKIDRHFSTCPTNHYPIVDTPEPGQLRAGEHTDFGSLTILALNDAPGGLQVRSPQGTWHDVSAGPGELIVNLGDMMARWTNDRWKSTVHRVVNPPRASRHESQRQSIGYFLHPNYDAEVACLETCQGPDNPPVYAPMMAGDHMRAKLNLLHASDTGRA